MPGLSDIARKRSLSTAVVYFAVAVAIIFAAKLGIDRLRPRPLQPLVDYALAHGDDYPMPAEIAGLFSIPHNGQPLRFRQIRTGTPDGHTHTLAVRVRPENGHVDILVNDVGPDGVGYYYHATPDGRRIKAVYADTEMRPVLDAQQQFAKEIEKWQAYIETVGSEP